MFAKSALSQPCFEVSLCNYLTVTRVLAKAWYHGATPRYSSQAGCNKVGAVIIMNQDLLVLTHAIREEENEA